MTQLVLTRDATGAVSYGLPFSDTNSLFTLAVNTEITIVAPTTASRYVAIFSYEPGTKVWVSTGLTSILLPTSTPASTLAQLNPQVREVNPGATLRFMTNDTSAQVGVSFYAIA